MSEDPSGHPASPRRPAELIARGRSVVGRGGQRHSRFTAWVLRMWAGRQVVGGGGGGSAWSTDFMRHWWPFAAAIFAPLVHYLLPAPHSALCLQSCNVERCDAKRALRVRCCVNSAAVHAGESLSAVSRWHAICFTDPGVQPEGESGATLCVWLLRNHSHRAEGEMKGRWG